MQLLANMQARTALLLFSLLLYCCCTYCCCTCCFAAAVLTALLKLYLLLTNTQDAGTAPNVVTYTALLKGVCSMGDMSAAERLLARMQAQRPPLLPNIRTINTLLRGCVRVGDVDLGYRSRRMCVCVCVRVCVCVCVCV
jgi:pentatricopeptide repeat protein